MARHEVHLKVTDEERAKALLPQGYIEYVEQRISELLDDELQERLIREDAEEIAKAFGQPDAVPYIEQFLHKWWWRGTVRGRDEANIRIVEDAPGEEGTVTDEDQ